MFTCEFCEIFKNTFFTEHLRATASVTIYLLKAEKIITSAIFNSVNNLRSHLSQVVGLVNSCYSQYEVLLFLWRVWDWLVADI